MVGRHPAARLPHSGQPQSPAGHRALGHLPSALPGPAGQGLLVTLLATRLDLWPFSASLKSLHPTQRLGDSLEEHPSGIRDHWPGVNQRPEPEASRGERSLRALGEPSLCTLLRRQEPHVEPARGRTVCVPEPPIPGGLEDSVLCRPRAAQKRKPACRGPAHDSDTGATRCGPLNWYRHSGVAAPQDPRHQGQAAPGSADWRSTQTHSRDSPRGMQFSV